MANQYPMAFNYKGPFNLKGTSGQMYVLQGDAAGNLYVVEGSGGGGNLTLPTVTNGIVYATDTAGDIKTNSGLTFDGSTFAGPGGFSVVSDGTVNGDAGFNFAGGSLVADNGGNLTAESLSTTNSQNPLIDNNGNINSATSLSFANAQSITLFSFGQATFASAGSVAISDTTITSNSIITLAQSGSTPLSETYSVAVTAGTGFTIYSSNSSSTATVNYLRVN